MKESADIWMERPEGLGNAREILQIFFLSSLDNRDPILGQQMEVVKSELLNGVSLWVKGLGAMPCKQPCFLPACNQIGASFQRRPGLSENREAQISCVCLEMIIVLKIMDLLKRTAFDDLFSIFYLLSNITWFFCLCSLEHMKLTYIPAQLLSHI